MNNQKVREAAARAGLKQYEVAALMKISPYTLSIRMRAELPEDEQKKIIDLITAEKIRRAKAVLSEQG